MDSADRQVYFDHQLWDYQGVEQRPILGSFTKETLIARLVDAWVPYFECHKCGRADYCKHVVWSTVNPHRSTDIQCGIAVTAIGNFVNSTFPLLHDLEAERKQEWLDGAYHLAMFVYKSELQVGNLLDQGVLDFWEEYVPRLFGQITRLREHLDGIAGNFREMPSFAATEKVLFVEGWTEKAFIDRLKESRLFWFLYTHVEVYDGAGNRDPKRIQMLLRKYTERGYEIYLQADADGHGPDILGALIRKCGLSPNNTFAFEYDFESSIPPALLLRALQRLGQLEHVSINDFRPIVNNASRPVAPLLKSAFGLDLKPLKISLAEATADLLNSAGAQWPSNDKFMKTELGRFLDFVRRA